MQSLNERAPLPTGEITEETYDPSLPFDFGMIHSDAYYEQYIEQFVPNTERRFFYRFFKRMFDILFSSLALIVLSPLMLAIALAVRIDSKGSALFRQKRMGRGGKTFDCYKFRSMRTDAPHDCATSLLEDPRQYQTRIGGFLRRTSLDELPQLWCVLRGTMSFIGYRPLCLTEEKCNEMRKRLSVFSLRPGISGYAQVHGRDAVYYKNKAVLDAEYVKSASLFGDLCLILQTVFIVIRRVGNFDNAKKTEADARSEDRETVKR